MSYKYGGEAKRQKKDISQIKHTNPAKKDGNPPSRKDENSSQRKPNHPVYSTPYSSSNWDISAGGGRKKYLFSRSCIFHGYFLFNLAPRGPQLATKLAPAFLGLAGALNTKGSLVHAKNLKDRWKLTFLASIIIWALACPTPIRDSNCSRVAVLISTLRLAIAPSRIHLYK